MAEISNRGALAVCAILTAALLLRVINLDADPSALISRDFITDEGWWAHNARNAFFYGHWIIDDNNQGLYSAYLYTVLLYLIFSLFGLTLTTVRVLSAVGGWLTVMLLFLLVRREISTRAALLASLLMGFSNLHIIYSRTGFAESTMVFFVALALWLWSMRVKHYRFALLSGVAFALTLLTKITAIYFLPGLALVALTMSIRRSVRRREAVLFLTGCGLAGAAYTIFVVIPDFGAWLRLNMTLGSASEWPTGFSGRMQSILKLLGSSFYAQAPLLTALSVVSICLMIVGAARDGAMKAIRNAGELEITGTMLLIGYLFSLSLTVYQPERRFLPVLFLMTILAASVLDKGWAALRVLGNNDYKMNGVGWFAVLFLLPAIGILQLRLRSLVPDFPIELLLIKFVILAGLIAVAIAISRGRTGPRFRRILLFASRWVFILLFSVLSLGLILKALLLWGLDIEARLSAAFGRNLLLASSAAVLICVGVILTRFMRPRLVVPLLAGGFLFVEGIQISTWLLQPTYTLREANKSLSDMLTRDDSVVTYYETVLLSSPAKVVLRSVRRRFNFEVFEQTDPEYILILRRDNWRDYSLEGMPPEEWPPPARFVPAKVAGFDLCPTRMRGPRFIVELYGLSTRTAPVDQSSTPKLR